MKKATRTLINNRPNSKYVTVEDVNLEGTLENHCYQNSVKLSDTNEKDLIVVSGWLVGDFLGEKGTAIIPHYWVLNEKTKKYYDPTPKPKNNKQSYEYVEDFDIFQYGNEHSILPLSLKLTSDGKFKARSNDGTHYIDLDKLDVQELYQLRHS
jgi:hypothetical protein